jgi:hypothetical protein
LTHDHKHQVGQTSFEENPRSNVLNQELHLSDGEVYPRIEGKQLQDLRVEVDFRGQVLNLDVDLTDMYRSLAFVRENHGEIDQPTYIQKHIRFRNCRRHCVRRVLRLIHHSKRVTVLTNIELVTRVAIAIPDLTDRYGRQEGQGKKGQNVLQHLESNNDCLCERVDAAERSHKKQQMRELKELDVS